jgi:hypothetical protein
MMQFICKIACVLLGGAMKKLLMLVPSPILAAILVLDLLLVTGIGVKNWGDRVPSNKATQVAENVTDAVLDKTGAAEKVGSNSTILTILFVALLIVGVYVAITLVIKTAIILMLIALVIGAVGSGLIVYLH